MYNRYLITIILLCVILVVPTSFFLIYTVYYIYSLDTLEYPNLYTLFLLILNFSLLFPPFFRLVMEDSNDNAFTLALLLKTFISKIGIIVFLTLIFYVISIFGAILLLIPTIIGVSMMVLLPLFIEQNEVKESIVKVFRIIRIENIGLFMDLLGIVSINVLLWAGVTYLVVDFENNLLVYITLRTLLHSTLFPLIYFYLTLKYKVEMNM